MSNRKKMITAIFAFLFCFFWSIPPVAAHPTLEIVYLTSSDAIPWNNLQDNTVYIFPNDSTSSSIPKNHNTAVSSNLARDTNIPYNNEWNVVFDGRYTFAGSATSSDDLTLYTLYNFTGRTKYTVYVSNLRKNDQVVNCERLYSDFVFQSFTIPGNSSAVTIVDASYAHWYLAFPAKCNVEGYVE